VLACHECDLLMREVTAPVGGSASCPRCGAVLYRNLGERFDWSLAFLVGAAVLYLIANAFPIVTMEAGGNRTIATLFGTVVSLQRTGSSPVAARVLFTAIVFPAVIIGLMIWMLLPLQLGRSPPGAALVFRALRASQPWGMVEVFMLGILCSIVKLAHLAALVVGPALWAFGGLIVLIAAAVACFEPAEYWARVRRASRESASAEARPVWP
jgi:paraquat-inducible protein A